MTTTIKTIYSPTYINNIEAGFWRQTRLIEINRLQLMCVDIDRQLKQACYYPITMVQSKGGDTKGGDTTQEN